MPLDQFPIVLNNRGSREGPIPVVMGVMPKNGTTTRMWFLGFTYKEICKTYSINMLVGFQGNVATFQEGWIKISSKGIVRSCTAEQVLSHILPPLAFRHATIKVVPDIKHEK